MLRARCGPQVGLLLMLLPEAVEALSALAHGHRLAVFRLLNSARGWDTSRTPVDDVRWALDELASRHGDLPVALVGHSLGGGVAMQFAYQFPHLVERLILVGAGGVTKDVNFVLRWASLPMGSEAIALLRLPLVLPAVQIMGRVLGVALGSSGLGRDLPNVLRILDDLPEPTASAAFSRTLRAVVDWRGQIVTMLDRCYLTEAIPVQIVWGTKDVVVPVRHARMAHAAMPGSRLEIFEGSGHFPFHDDPARFIDVVERFIDSTGPAEYDQASLRELLRTGGGEQAVSGPAPTRVAVLNAMGSDERSAT